MKNIILQILDKYYFFMTVCSIVLIPVLGLFPWDREGNLQYRLKKFISILVVGLCITVGITYIKISYVQVPNVEGLQYNSARSIFLENDLECKVISGDGVVVEQSVSKNSYIKKGTVIGLVLGEAYINYQSFNSAEECLEKAEEYFNKEQYEYSFRIYQHEYLENNAVALNNLGYLYSRGLGVEKDDEKAKNYYLLAFEAGEDLGLSNYVVNNIKNPHYIEDVLEALELGFQFNDENAVNYIKAIIRDSNLKKYNLKNENDFFKLNEDKKIEILKNCIEQMEKVKASDDNLKQDAFHIPCTIPQVGKVAHNIIMYLDEDSETRTYLEDIYGVINVSHFIILGLKYDWEVDEEKFIVYSLDKAQRELTLEHYSEATKIYFKLLELEPNNSTALCNLGYIYEHGLETPIDLEKAREYYSKAIENGNEQALHNLLALELMSDKSLDMFDSIIWYGIEQEDGNICRFIAASIYQNENILEEFAVKLCQEIEIIDGNLLWRWQEEEKIRAYNRPIDSVDTRYVEIGIGNETTEEQNTPYTLYLKEKRICPYIHLLGSGFDENTMGNL